MLRQDAHQPCSGAPLLLPCKWDAECWLQYLLPGDNWPWGSALQSTHPPSFLAYLLLLSTSSSAPPLLPPRRHRAAPDWLLVSRTGLLLWPRSLPSLLRRSSVSLPVFQLLHKGIHVAMQPVESGGAATARTITATSVGGAGTPPPVFCLCFWKCPAPLHPLLRHVVFVVAAPSFNEVRLLVLHRVAGWATAGWAVYLHLRVHAAQPQSTCALVNRRRVCGQTKRHLCTWARGCGSPPQPHAPPPHTLWLSG